MRLQEILVLKNITQSMLAKKLKVTQPCISNWCNRKGQPNIQTMQKLADALDVDLQTIVACFVQDNKKTKKE